jgi:glycolate oxidase iron-sulfur subunit
MAAISFIKRRPGLIALLPPRLRALIALSPDGAVARDIPELSAAAGVRRQRVGLITGCVQRVFFGEVNEATVRLLVAEGCDVAAPASQGCCGALALHAGLQADAREFARQLIAVFERQEVDTIVVNAAGCGSTLKEYGELLDGDPVWAARAKAFSAKVRDITEVLTELQPTRASRHPMPLRIAYHDACHLAHGQGVRQQPRDLLRSIPGVSIEPFAESEVCCGSAGIFNLVQPEMAGVLGRRKADHIETSGADAVVTSNPGCVLQIRSAAQAAGHRRPIVHIVEILDASVRGVEPAAFLRHHSPH